jgi:hypothetical protein
MAFDILPQIRPRRTLNSAILSPPQADLGLIGKLQNNSWL